MDIWTFFTCVGIDILRENAILSFIAPNNWVSNTGASKVRDKILRESRILEFIDFGSFMIFENASIQTMIFILKKEKVQQKYIAKYSKILDGKLPYIELSNFLLKETDERFSVYDSEIDTYKLLDSNITFLQKNIASVLYEIEKNKNFKLDEKNEVAQGLITPNDNVSKDSLKILGDNFNIGDGIFNLTTEEKESLFLEDNELDLIKPLYTSKEISRYYANKQNKLWVVYTNSKFKDPKHIKPYPNLKKHLDKFEQVITASSGNKPYGIHRARNEKFFKGEKILSLRKSSNRPSFSYVNFDSYVNQAFYVIQSNRINLKYLTALLNSKMVAFWLRHQGKMQGDNYQIDKEPILNIPIKTLEKTKPFEILVDEILQAKNNGKDTTALETKIDDLVYKLYNLTADEIKIIESIN
jgi:adenine-specific DNA-methyltransferase